MQTAVQLLIQIGNILFQLLPSIEKYGPQIIDDLKQDWEMLTLAISGDGVITPAQHDQVMANLDRAHNLFQQNTADVDDTGDHSGA